MTSVAEVKCVCVCVVCASKGVYTFQWGVQTWGFQATSSLLTSHDPTNVCTCTCIISQVQHVLLAEFTLYMHEHVNISQRDKARQTNYAWRQLLFPRAKWAASGGTRTCDKLHIVQMLYQLSHWGSSAGKAECYTSAEASLPCYTGYSNSVLNSVLLSINSNSVLNVMTWVHSMEIGIFGGIVTLAHSSALSCPVYQGRDAFVPV